MVEAVHVIVRDANAERAALKALGSAPPNLAFHHFATKDVFCRDYGAVFICRREAAWRTPPLVAIDWGYAPSHSGLGDDNRVIPMSMARTLGVPCVSGCLNLHGGDIDTNGSGILLAAEGSLRARNPDFSAQQIEQAVTAMLGVSQVVWLTDLVNDICQRVDDVARFVSVDTVVMSVATNPSDPSHDALQENRRRLTAVRRDGKPLRMVPLPLPESEGAATRASYTSFYVCNELIFVPQFRQRTDVQARERLASVFPGRQIVGIECDLNEGCGTVHGRTRQIPSLDVAEKGVS